MKVPAELGAAMATLAGDIRSGPLRGFGLRHAALIVAFAVLYDLLGQLGWLDLASWSFGRRLYGFRMLPPHLAITACAILSAVVAENALPGSPFRILRHLLAVLAGSVVAVLVLEGWASYLPPPSSKELATLNFLGGLGSARTHKLALHFLQGTYMATLVVALNAVFEASRRASAELHAARMAALSAQHALVEGDLRAMQARVDPDLLFDSLLEIDRAYAQGVGEGQEQLDALIRFLRAALPGDSAATSTVAREQELAEAYVALAAARAPARLEVEITSEPLARGELMPPMLLLPLVRWAIAGGSARHLRIDLRRATPRMEITVESQGPAAEAPRDDEIAGVRARLAQLFAEDGRLEVSRQGELRRAVLALPLAASPQGALPSAA